MKSWLSNSWLHNRLSAPLLLFSVVLAVYYPALLSGIHPIDDPGIFALFSASPPLSDILLPGNGYYYRPLVELSFYLDHLLWGMEPATMHLENILMHSANTLLVFMLARRVCRDDKAPLIPLFSALLFALHPVNVEAVAWIAGRTDTLLALFVLSAAYFWLRWLEKPRWQDMAATLLLFAAALLTKETALAFAAVALLLAVAWPGAATLRERLTAVVIMTAPVALLAIAALLSRSDSGSLSRFLSGAELRAGEAAWKILVAIGFYFKKLIDPFPLNFAINEVPQLYGLLGGALLPFFWWLFRRNRHSGILLISAMLFVSPATVVAVRQIAWTPYAERYLYLATAFFALGMGGIFEACQRKYPAFLKIFFVMLLCGSALGSFQRNLLWKDSFSFFQDAVAKSPEFGSVYYSLGALLVQKGEIDRAAAAFATADRLNRRDSMRYPIKLSIMGIKLSKGKYLEARAYFFQLFNEKKDAPVDFLELLYKADGKRIETIQKDERLLLARDLLGTIALLNQKKPDPFWMYRSGQIALFAGNSAEAADFFRRAYLTAPADAYYRGAAKTNYLRLEVAK